MNRPSTNPATALVATRIIWAAMLVGLLSFTFVIIFLNMQKGPLPANSPQTELPRTMMLIAGAMIVVTIPVGYILRSQFYKRYWVGDVVTPQGYVSGNILLFALCEGPAFFSLIACFIGQSLWPYALPAAIAIAVLVLNFPTGAAMRSATQLDHAMPPQ